MLIYLVTQQHLKICFFCMCGYIMFAIVAAVPEIKKPIMSLLFFQYLLSIMNKR